MEGRTRVQALAACGQILQPLTRILIKLGISAPELTNVCKQVFVHIAADRLAGSKRRLNRSRIAIVTGLTRAEVTKLLNPRSSQQKTLQSHLHRARRVINGWRRDTEFASRGGRPRVLSRKGPHGSFEALVRRYSGDIPARAMLDELLTMAAVTKQKDGRIRLRPQKEPSTTNARDLELLGKQGRALLDTLCHNIQDPSDPLFLGTVVGRRIDPEVLRLLLRRIQTQGREFLSHLDDQFKHPPRTHKGRREAKSSTLGVTLFTYRDARASKNDQR